MQKQDKREGLCAYLCVCLCEEEKEITFTTAGGRNAGMEGVNSVGMTEVGVFSGTN